MKLLTLCFIGLFIFTSCSSTIESCNCQSIDIYESASDSLLPFYRLNSKTYHSFDAFRVQDKKATLQLIEQVKKDLNNNLVDQQTIGKKYVLKINCKFSKDIIIETDEEIMTINEQNYTHHGELVSIIKTLLPEKKDPK